jgi:glycosyltransferase involved in cell wall biosynthesis
MRPLVDVLIATRQGEKYIEAQISSILDQSFSDFQILVRDDGSTDATCAILSRIQKQHPLKLQLIEGEQLGIVKNFEQLLKLTKNSYAFLSDQDDLWMKDKIASSLHLMQTMEKKYGRKTPLLVHTDLSVVDEALAPIAPSFWKYARLHPNPGFNRLLVQNSITGCTCLLNRPLIDLAQHFPAQVYSHDGWIAWLAAGFGCIGSLPNPTVLYRQHSANSLGAKKMSVLAYLKRAFCHPDSAAWDARHDQAKAFFTLHGEKLVSEKKKALQAFLKAPHENWLQRKVAFFRYQFFWMGLLRNLTKFFLPHPF